MWQTFAHKSSAQAHLKGDHVVYCYKAIGMSGQLSHRSRLCRNSRRGERLLSYRLVLKYEVSLTSCQLFELPTINRSW